MGGVNKEQKDFIYKLEQFLSKVQPQVFCSMKCSSKDCGLDIKLQVEHEKKISE